MAKKLEYFEDLMGREFYEFYKKTRRKPSRIIDQYNYFEKAIGGMVEELRQMMVETDHGVHLKGLGIMYKKPFGEFMQKLSLFTQTKIHRRATNFYLEDDYLRMMYIPTNLPRGDDNKKEKVEDKANAVILHRKLKLKK